MKTEERVPLADRTMFRVGGPAALFITAERIEEVPEAYGQAAERGLPVYPLGEGSNVLASDAEIAKAIVHLSASAVTYEDSADADTVLVTAEGGAIWDDLVAETNARGLWGLENLASIPGTVGAAPVQNIGAYGREASDAIASVEAYDPAHGDFVRYAASECGFGYRDSAFKRVPGRMIARVTFSLSRVPQPELSYPDLAARVAAGDDLSTPAKVADAVRAIRMRKFAGLGTLGTAGSFFKNPVISRDAFAALRARYPGLPGYESREGTESGAGDGIKVPLAWILDRALGLRGYANGPARVFEGQPLVLVAERGARMEDVDALANDVAARVHDATGIVIEREVQTLR